MTRPALLPLLLLSLLPLGTVAAMAQDRRDDRPSFILCMADDQGWGDVGYNGNPVPKTPVLDAMSKTGLRFDRFYAAAPVCSPTRGSVLTGRHPNRFGCFSWGHTLRPQEVTLAEALRKAGYATGHFGKWHLGSVRPESPVSPGRSGFDEWLSSPNFFENDPLMCRNGQVVQAQGESSRVVVEAALAFIRKSAARKQPFLAVVWFGSPHSPHQAAPENRALYPDLPPAQQQYYGEVTGIDRAMGRLREQLKETGSARNTLLWYTSDNGPQGPDRRPGSAGGLRGRKGSLWDGGIRVPTLLEWPAKIPVPRVTSTPCGSVDFYPTLLELAGVKVPDQPPLDGVSLVSLLTGKPGRPAARKKPLGFWDYPAAGRPVRSTELLQAQAEGKPSTEDEAALLKPDPTVDETARPGPAAWIDGEYKLHRIPQRDGSLKFPLYHLGQDRAETQDRAAAEPDRVKRMQAELEAWQLSVARSLKGADYR